MSSNEETTANEQAVTSMSDKFKVGWSKLELYQKIIFIVLVVSLPLTMFFPQLMQILLLPISLLACNV